MKLASRFLMVLSLGVSVTAFAAEPTKVTVLGDQPGAKISPLFYGLMTEEINHAYDGGLYAELVQNRTFQDSDKPVCWEAVGDGSIEIDESSPVNTTALTRSLRLNIASPGKRVGIANHGFWGIPAWPNTKYRATFYARGGDGSPLQASIESNDGTILATADVQVSGADWKKYEVVLSTKDVPVTTDNKFVISSTGKGPIWFSLVSLFPPTYHDRPNGNRIDLMDKMAALHPGFLRFPGGNFLEGDTVATRFEWKKTIGPLENRPGHMGCWSYRASDGLGLLEFLEWCEDLKMEPILAVYAGYSLQQQHVNPGADLEPFVQEALEEIEYCTGDVNTRWGKQRADDGHPEPFRIQYIEIGNEDWFDKSHTYDARFTQLFNAIKGKYPALKCIATARDVHSSTPDLIDDHGYPSPLDMLSMWDKYDKYPANDPKVFFGEWATQDGEPTPTMRAALSDAAWLIALQRDADSVPMNCYAPLFVNVNNTPQRANPHVKRGWQWPTNLIGYNAAESFGSPSYFAQAMFAKAWGDEALPVKIDLGSAREQSAGAVGVGTWRTSAEFKDLKVVDDAKTIDLLAADADPAMKMQNTHGQWETVDGSVRQLDSNAESYAVMGDKDWKDYSVHVKAKKTGGEEGFLVLFHYRDAEHFGWFNVGGWQNSRAALEIADGGRQVEIGKSRPFSVETNRWYDIQVDVKGEVIKCFVDGKLIVQTIDPTVQLDKKLFVGATKSDGNGQVILKVVNRSATAQQVAFDLKSVGNISNHAEEEMLQGDPKDVNTLDAPTRVAPVSKTFDDAGSQFKHEFPGSSVTVIRLQKSDK